LLSVGSLVAIVMLWLVKMPGKNEVIH
jgi:hypothetical protein